MLGGFLQNLGRFFATHPSNTAVLPRANGGEEYNGVVHGALQLTLESEEANGP